MSGNFLSPEAITMRYASNRSKHLVLVVTSQYQEFVLGNYSELCDLILVSATAELVGPGSITLGEWQNHLEDEQNTNAAYTSKREMFDLYGTKPHTNTIDLFGNGTYHGAIDIRIEGMTRQTNIIRDERHTINDTEIVIPTDYGLVDQRGTNRTRTPASIRLEAIHLNPSIRVTSRFLGSHTSQKRLCRFVEDYADLYPLDTSSNPPKEVFRKAGGDINWFCTNADLPVPGFAVGDVNFPANCVTKIILEFKMTPRVVQ